MRLPSFSSESLRGTALLLTRIISNKRSSLMEGPVKLVRCGKAAPLDWSKSRPLKEALRRNVKAALAGRPAPCCCS